MEQVAHQAVVMQFILEMARNAQQDPRGCFRQFFQKAKVSVHSDSPAAVHCNAAEISPSSLCILVLYTRLFMHNTDCYTERICVSLKSALAIKMSY